jgi:alpha-N-arabinofuranosidase
MKELVTRHSTIMDRYDPQKRVALVPDEWGTWYNVEPGTNPGFLYQQNTMRDAIVAGINLHIFNQHCDRVRIANIAQTVNVLQAVILTEDEKMILTPTYWVFYLYKVHHDATLLPLTFASPKYEVNGRQIDAISATASRDDSGKIHITLVNSDPNKAQHIECDLRGITAQNITGQILTSARIDDHNTFTQPDKVKVVAFNGAKLNRGALSIQLPAKSVVMLEIR